jgi:hypothetical protein
MTEAFRKHVIERKKEEKRLQEELLRQQVQEEQGGGAAAEVINSPFSAVPVRLCMSVCSVRAE